MKFLRTMQTTEKFGEKQLKIPDSNLILIFSHKYLPE